MAKERLIILPAKTKLIVPVLELLGGCQLLSKLITDEAKVRRAFLMGSKMLPTTNV